MTIEQQNAAIEAQYLRGDVLRAGAPIETLIKYCGAEIVPSLVDAELRVAQLDAAINAINDAYPVDFDSIYSGVDATALPADVAARLATLTAEREAAREARRVAYAPVRAKADEIDSGADTYFA